MVSIDINKQGIDAYCPFVQGIRRPIENSVISLIVMVIDSLPFGESFPCAQVKGCR
jgi:hypothetical protein